MRPAKEHHVCGDHGEGPGGQPVRVPDDPPVHGVGAAEERHGVEDGHDRLEAAVDHRVDHHGNPRIGAVAEEAAHAKLGQI